MSITSENTLPPRDGRYRPYTAANRLRREAQLPNDKYLDFDKPILGLIWLKVTNHNPARACVGLTAPQDGQTPSQVPLYPREDMRVRLSDHKVALAEVGFEEGSDAIEVYYDDRTHNGSGWYRCTWDTPLRVGRAGDVILISYMLVKDTKDFNLFLSFCT